MKAHVKQGIGDGWLSLANEVQRQLREHDRQARVDPTVGSSGLLELETQTIPSQQPRARALARRYEAISRRTCERCGARVVSAGAGPVVTILCGRCSAAE
jgi:hypothetical protein